MSISTPQKKSSFLIRANPQFSEDLFIFTKKLVFGKLHSLCSDTNIYQKITKDEYLEPCETSIIELLCENS